MPSSAKKKASTKAWKEKNADHIRAYQREWQRKNKKKFSEWRRDWLSKNPKRIAPKRSGDYSNNRKKPEFMYKQYIHGASIRNFVFSLTFDEFMVYWNAPCSYCGESTDSIGLDRIDNSLGYIVGNVTPCCKVCNYMKRTMDVNSFMEHCVKIVSFGYTGFGGS